MARGNLGVGFANYGHALYDEGHTYWLMRRAREELAKAASIGLGKDGSTYAEALSFFEKCLLSIEDWLARFEEADPAELARFPLGRSKREKQYRRWCLDKGLFLNPMNDVCTESVAACDVLTLPSHRGESVGITFLAFFNQMKEEFAYARWCIFDGIHSHNVHFADRGVKLAFNADHALYSLGLEQIKTAFRSAYSLLDKIAYFVNDYWQLGIPAKQVDFRSVWTEPAKKGVPSHVRSALETSQNLYLRALYWLSLDIYSKDLHDVAQPEAKALNDLRNHLEHKFVKVVLVKSFAAPTGIFADRLAHEIEPDDLIAKTEQLLQVCRSALTYLCLAMHVTEQSAHDHTERFPVEVEEYPDDLKL